MASGRGDIQLYGRLGPSCARVRWVVWGPREHMAHPRRVTTAQLQPSGFIKRISESGFVCSVFCIFKVG